VDFAGLLLLATAGIFLFLAVHPFVTYPLSLRGIRLVKPAPIRKSSGDAGAQPLTFALCVCAYNEAGVIRTKVENMLELRRRLGQLQILVYVDGSTDGTTEILQPYADQVDLVVSPQRRGKTYGLNRLVAMAHADIVVLTDANVHIEPNALVNMARYFQDREVGCVCGSLTYVNAETTTAATGSAYWRLEEHIKQLESDTGSVMGADGSLYGIRRQLYRSIPRGVADDMHLSLRILCEGFRIIRAPDVRAFERSVPDAREEYNRKIRIACQAFTSHQMLWPRLRQLNALTVYKYLSHKLLRWFTLVFLVLSAAFALAGIAVVAGLALALGLAVVGTLTLAAERFVRVRLLTFIAEALRSFAATAIGVWRAMKGERFRMWTPAASIRDAGTPPA
jgi:cellulose synthase/poly-beta-1,6-N-acetylglucosamine synthase-like glycosyltransferase